MLIAAYSNNRKAWSVYKQIKPAVRNFKFLWRCNSQFDAIKLARGINNGELICEDRFVSCGSCIKCELAVEVVLWLPPKRH